MEQTFARLRENRFDFVFNSQSVFKKLMIALSRPGTLVDLPEIPLSAPNQDYNFLMQVVLTLCDIETSFHVYGEEEEIVRQFEQYISINTGAKKDMLERAQFVFSLGPGISHRINELQQGSLELPNTSATLFYTVSGFSSQLDSPGLCLKCRGPGIKDTTEVFIQDGDKREVETWIDNRRNFPLGVDIFLVSKEGQVCGLPRSTNITSI